MGKVMLRTGKKFCYHIRIGCVTCPNLLKMAIPIGAMKSLAGFGGSGSIFHWTSGLSPAATLAQGHSVEKKQGLFFLQRAFFFQNRHVRFPL